MLPSTAEPGFDPKRGRKRDMHEQKIVEVTGEKDATEYGFMKKLFAAYRTHATAQTGASTYRNLRTPATTFNKRAPWPT